MKYTLLIVGLLGLSSLTACAPTFHKGVYIGPAGQQELVECRPETNAHGNEIWFCFQDEREGW